MRLFAWILTAGAASVSACGDSVAGTDGSGNSTSGTSTVDATTSVPTTTGDPTTDTTPTTTTGPIDCAVLDDCVDAASECRLALACDAGACVYEDAPAGTPVAGQTAGDCTVLACDGNGAVAPLPDLTDVEDDGVLCTLDACDGTTPTHTPGMTACYTGADGTAGVGACKAGVQTCDANGPTGPCVGEIVPQPENCDTDVIDEDCDGLANEDGDACLCAPGSEIACYPGPPATQGVGLCHAGTQTCTPDGLDFSPCAGEVVPEDEDCDPADVDEDCDGLTDESGPSCTCGDGDVSDGEACDDGNNVDDDGCSADCQEAVKVVQIGTGAGFSCALFSHGKVKCWGFNDAGQLGLGDTEDRGDQPGEMGAALPFVDVGGDVAEIAVGSFHVCARLVSGAVKCWGRNGDGQLGLGDKNHRGDQPGEMGNALPTVQLGGGAVVQLACGNSSAARASPTSRSSAGGSAGCWDSATPITAATSPARWATRCPPCQSTPPRTSTSALRIAASA
ncbi:hypothetical protein [Nannocystis radixulma]|uniref:Myxococcus cysteine-rich repeat-containing protein n=1 Tax=Nannocystis radixulma TaxID=2995305 RepID=A0ABT5AXM6_9BACT|nr:hypothetical protein [Nannocystis radixulma]MDC0666602.1 hypothetical protein [Nannocystis radixulma]